MDEINVLSKLILRLIRAGIGVRVIYCFIKMIDGQEVEVYKSRVKKAIKYYILAESIFQLKDIAIYYFS